MKILHVNTLFAPRRLGGAEIFLERLATEQVARGHQTLVACLSPTPTRHGDESLAVHEFSLRNVYWPFDGERHPRWQKAVWHLRNSYGQGGAADICALLRGEQPDLVHTHNLAGFTSAAWHAVRSQGIPLVHTIHDYALLCPSSTMFRKETNCDAQCLGCRMMTWPHRRNSRAVDAVVGVSDFVLQRHLKNGYFTKATPHVIHNGNPRLTTGAPEAARSASSRLRVGYLGRLAPAKGVEFMLNALAPLSPERCELIVAGAGEPAYESMLKDRYAPQGVRFVGKVDAGEFLAGIDLLVAPSLWHEPFGLVLCEAMGAGVPVVAAAVGGIPEILENEERGALFNSGDAEGLRKQVARLADDRTLLARMSRCCQEQKDEHRFERTVEGYLNVYSQLLDSRKVDSEALLSPVSN